MTNYSADLAFTSGPESLVCTNQSWKPAKKRLFYYKDYANNAENPGQAIGADWRNYPAKTG